MWGTEGRLPYLSPHPGEVPQPLTKTLASVSPQRVAGLRRAPQPQPERDEYGHKVGQQPQELGAGGVIDHWELPAVAPTGDPHMVGEGTVAKRMEPYLA